MSKFIFQELIFEHASAIFKRQSTLTKLFKW